LLEVLKKCKIPVLYYKNDQINRFKGDSIDFLKKISEYLKYYFEFFKNMIFWIFGIILCRFIKRDIEVVLNNIEGFLNSILYDTRV
jgi:hypothetical protein